MLDSLNPFLAQTVYLFTALVMGGLHAATLFRYRTASDYYSNGDILSYNFWKLAALIFDWGGLSLWGIAFLSQLLSFIGGFFASLNLFVWYYIVGGLGATSAISVIVLYALTYDGAHSELKNTDAAIATKA